MSKIEIIEMCASICDERANRMYDKALEAKEDGQKGLERHFDARAIEAMCCAEQIRQLVREAV